MSSKKMIRKFGDTRDTSIITDNEKYFFRSVFTGRDAPDGGVGAFMRMNIFEYKNEIKFKILRIRSNENLYIPYPECRFKAVNVE